MEGVQIQTIHSIQITFDDGTMIHCQQFADNSTRLFPPDGLVGLPNSNLALLLFNSFQKLVRSAAKSHYHLIPIQRQPFPLILLDSLPFQSLLCASTALQRYRKRQSPTNPIVVLVLAVAPLRTRILWRP